MEFKYSKIITNESQQKTANMLLFGKIGEDVSGNLFSHEMKSLADSGIKNINILINSPGGSVQEGYSIVATMNLLQENGININIKNVGIAYSMAGIILACGRKKKRKMYDYATNMMHDPKFKQDAILSDSERDMLLKIKDSLAIMLSNNTNKSKEEIISLMENETYLNSDDSRKLEFVDEVEMTGKKVNLPQSAIERMAACADLYNNKSINKIKMSELNGLLNLNPEASEGSRMEAVKLLQNKANKVTELENSLTVVNNKIKLLEAENENLKKEKNRVTAESLVNDAIVAGKINKESKDKWIENAVKDFENTKSLIDSLIVIPTSINAQLDKSSTDVKAKAEKFAKMLNTPSEIDSLTNEEMKDLEDSYNKVYGKVDISRIN
jgi:ATP-dependent Clp protease protease subunit